LAHPKHLSELALHLPDLAATERLGARLAVLLSPGLKIYLSGDLGSGKTSLVRALLRAAGHAGRVKSPSYTLLELYVVSSLNLYHFDFYRFREQKEWVDAGFRELFNENSVCIVEWPEKAGALLPPPDLEFSLEIRPPGRDVRINAHSAAGETCLTALQNADS
jgi:tRNA threonylcarbamoyladenosine biosynthesis protein TsaE